MQRAAPGRNAHSFRLLVSLLCLLSVSALAQERRVERTPDNNNTLKPFIIAQFGTFLAGTGTGIFAVPPMFSMPAEAIAISTDISLKFTPPVFGRISDKNSLEPNAARDANSADFCVNEFTLQQYQAQHKNLFAFNFQLVPEEVRPLFGIVDEGFWGPLVASGEMSVFHLNADVVVTLSGPGVLDDENAYPLRVQLPEGKHEFLWEAGTQLSPVADIAFPLAVWPIQIAAETKALPAFKKFFSDRRVLKEIINNPANAGFVDVAVAAGIKSDITKNLLKTLTKGGGIGKKVQRAIFVGSPATSEMLDLISSSVSFARNSFTQTVTVLDIHTPTITTSEPEKTLEATDLGGTRLVRVYDELLASLDHSDVCGRPTRVSGDAPNILPIGTTTIQWTTTDLEPDQDEAEYYKGGISSTATVDQVITVEDTLPPIIVAPAGQVIESPDTMVDPAGVDLGWPQVIDLADPEPVIANDAPAMFANDTRLAIDWSATDGSGNAARQVQWLTAKTPNSNTAPFVAPVNAGTRTAETVDIRLDGIDPDVLPTSRGFDLADPLSFEIVDYPDQGELEAPLRPFFIEDFRLTPIGETEVKGARTSPLGNNAADFAALPNPAVLQSPNQQRGDFLRERYCDVSPPIPIPLNFVFQPTYVHVTDDGTYYVRDKFWDCDNATGFADFPGDRISKWSRDREFLAEFRLDGFDGVPSDVFTVDSDTNIWWTDSGPDISAFLSAQDISKIDKDLGGYEVSRFAVAPEVVGFEYGIKAVHADPVNGLFYVNDNVGVEVYRVEDRELLGRLDIAGEEMFLNPLGISQFEMSCQQSAPVPKRAPRNRYWMTTDSKGNLYISDACENLIHKFEPSRVNRDGAFEAGEYVGWLGRCYMNVPPWNGCDETKQVTRGFTCRTGRCTRTETFGEAPGQFELPVHLAVSPGDILYVADFMNLRVQRFGDVGTFAGQAVSTGTGINAGDDPGFVLGNMGPPRSVSVNSSSFYVMEAENDADFFLHSFKTVPFFMIEADGNEVDQDGDGYADNSVFLKYTSDFNFPGNTGRVVANDFFSYRVNDGLADSPVSLGTVTVLRNFRPPEQLALRCYEPGQLDDEVDCSVNEDGALIVELVAEDPDGILGFDGLDVLSYRMEDAPAAGSLTFESATNGTAFYRFTPDADFYGVDEFRYSVTDSTTIRPLAGPVRVEGAFSLTVLPVPDPPVLVVDSTTTAARGFPATISASYSDVDEDPNEPEPTVYVDWGDGAIEQQGEIVEDGEDEYMMTGPVLTATVPGSGNIVATHTFANSVAENVRVCLNSVDSVEPICEAVTQEVVDATQVTVAFDADTSDVQPGDTFAISLDVTNQPPDGWAGLQARGVRSTIDVPDAFALVAADPRCSAVGSPVQLTCDIGDLSPDQTVVLDLDLRVRVGLVPVPGYLIRAVAEHDDFDIADEISSDLLVEVIWVDTDADMLPDAWELLNFGGLTADPDADPDSDGLNNLEEYLALADPNLVDTDADGKTDEEEYERYLTNPGNADTDGDGLPDAWEIDSGLDANTSDAEEDPDDDRLSNADEFELGTEPLNADTDTDEVLDGADNCPLAANSRQRNFDADASGNACDQYYLVGMETVADNDRNGIENVVQLRSTTPPFGQPDSWIVVSDGRTGELQTQYRPFGNDQAALGLQVLPQVGDSMLAIASERRSDGGPSITVVDTLTGRVAAQISSLPPTSRLLAMRALTPELNDGQQRLALLMENTATGAFEVTIADVNSGVSELLVGVPQSAAPGWTRAGLEALASNGSQLVAVLLAGAVEQGVVAAVQLVSVTDGAIVTEIQPETAGFAAIEMHVVPDVIDDGTDDIAIRLRHSGDGREMIRIFDLPTGSLLSEFSALGASEAAGGEVIFNFAVVDTANESAIALFSVLDGELEVSVRDIVSGDEIHRVIFSGAPKTYRNFNSLLQNFGGAESNELAVILEDTATGEHSIEVRDIQTGESLMLDAPPTSGFSSSSALSGWTLLLLMMSCLARFRFGRKTKISYY